MSKKKMHVIPTDKKDIKFLPCCLIMTYEELSGNTLTIFHWINFNFSFSFFFHILFVQSV